MRRSRKVTSRSVRAKTKETHHITRKRNAVPVDECAICHRIREVPYLGETVCRDCGVPLLDQFFSRGKEGRA